MEIGSFAARSRASQDQSVEVQTKRPSHNGAIAAVVVLLLIGAFVLFTPQGQSILNQGFQLLSGSSTSSSSSSVSTGQSSSSVSTSSSTSSSVSFSCPVHPTATSLVAPDIHSNNTAIWYPPDYCTLASYALGLINQDRASNGTAPVTLGYDLAAQQHVDSMLYYDYFSHNDTQGLKPYMRYTSLGGHSSDFENVATEYNSQFSSTSDVEGAIKSLEGQMMNNDVTCCQNLHRYNILGSLHTQVSIGIAYNSTTVYFGEEFVNNYIALDVYPPAGCALSGNCTVILSGVPLNVNVTADISAVYVAYDKTPSAVTPAQLNAGAHEYGPGLLIGGVLPCSTPPFCPSFGSGITVYADADKWTINSKTLFEIEFSLHDFINGTNGKAGYGPGVYTIYVVLGQSTNDAITTLSVEVS